MRVGVLVLGPVFIIGFSSGGSARGRAPGGEAPWEAQNAYFFEIQGAVETLFRTESQTVWQPKLRVLAPTVTRCADNRWRMYFESRGSADRRTVICSAVSDDLIRWRHEDGIRLEGFGGVGGPRFLSLPDGRGRLYCFAS